DLLVRVTTRESTRLARGWCGNSFARMTLGSARRGGCPTDERLNGIGQLGKIEGLQQDGVGQILDGARVAAGDDDDRQRAKHRLPAQMLQEIPAVGPWHDQIRDDQRRWW